MVSAAFCAALPFRSAPLEAAVGEVLGTLSVFEDTSLPWWHEYRGRYPTLGSTLPVIRLMIQQSNCFVVVERGAAGMNAMTRERSLMQSGEMRQGSQFGQGQVVASDYGLSPEIVFQNNNAGGASASLGGLVGGLLSFITPLLSTLTLLWVRGEAPSASVVLAAVMIIGAAVMATRIR